MVFLILSFIIKYCICFYRLWNFSEEDEVHKILPSRAGLGVYLCQVSHLESQARCECLSPSLVSSVVKNAENLELVLVNHEEEHSVIETRKFVVPGIAKLTLFMHSI